VSHNTHRYEGKKHSWQEEGESGGTPEAVIVAAAKRWDASVVSRPTLFSATGVILTNGLDAPISTTPFSFLLSFSSFANCGSRSRTGIWQKQGYYPKRHHKLTHHGNPFLSRLAETTPIAPKIAPIRPPIKEAKMGIHHLLSARWLNCFPWITIAVSISSFKVASLSVGRSVFVSPDARRAIRAKLSG
jgi:hypothetical protein